MKGAKGIIGLAVLVMAQLVYAQNQNPELSIGQNTKLTAGGLFTFGYSGDYGNETSSDHGLAGGVDGKVSGYYYNPNFLSFTVSPYYNQSRDDSSYQSMTGSSGVGGTANFFTGSHFPGAVSYHYDYNSTGTFGIADQPNFTTVGKNHGLGVSWSALVPGLPTLTVGFSDGGGTGTVYGTSEVTSSSSTLFNVHSGYQVAGFGLKAYFDRNTLDSKLPEFLSGTLASQQDSVSHDLGFNAQHALPWEGSFYANFDRMVASSNYTYGGESATGSDYTDDIVNSGASFHPTRKLSLNVTQSYTNNLTGYVEQSLTSTGTPLPGLSLGQGAHSSTVGGGVTYQINSFLATSAEAVFYDQYYYGKSYSGTFVSGTVNYNKRVLDMFTFSASVIDASNGQGTNALGFVGNVNFFHHFGAWQTSGVFSYAQNVQSLLITYTTSYYNYTANVRRRLPWGMSWTAAFNGNHSGLSSSKGTTNHSESYSTSLGSRRFTLTGSYTQSKGESLLGAGGLVSVSATPGVNDYISFDGSSYGGGLSVTPLRRLVISASYNRAISNTLAQAISHNDLQIYNAQLQYHLRRIGVQAGYTRFQQGISAVGTPANTTSYFAGITRWFDFF